MCALAEFRRRNDLVYSKGAWEKLRRNSTPTGVSLSMSDRTGTWPVPSDCNGGPKFPHITVGSRVLPEVLSGRQEYFLKAARKNIPVKNDLSSLGRVALPRPPPYGPRGKNGPYRTQTNPRTAKPTSTDLTSITARQPIIGRRPQLLRLDLAEGLLGAMPALRSMPGPPHRQQDPVRGQPGKDVTRGRAGTRRGRATPRLGTWST